MRNFSKLIIHACLLIVVFCLSSCSSALVLTEKVVDSDAIVYSSQLEKILQKKVLRVGTTGDFVPFSYQMENEDSTFLVGIDIELAKDLAESLGAELQFVNTSWKTLMSDLLADKFDIGMSGITIILIRQQEALFSIPLLASGKATITRDEMVDQFSSLSAINQAGVRVIVNPGGTNELFAKANFPKATLIENDDNLSIFQKIVDGTADLMVTDAIETLVQEQIHPELEAVNPEKPFNFFEMGYLLPVDHTFKAYVDQWLNLRQKDGTYQRIFDAELSNIKNRANAKE